MYTDTNITTDNLFLTDTDTDIGNINTNILVWAEIIGKTDYRSSPNKANNS